MQIGVYKMFYFLQKKNFVYLSVYDPTQEIQCTYNEGKNISVWNAGGRKKVRIQKKNKP